MIFVGNKTKKAIDRKFFQKIAEKVLKEESRFEEGLSIVLVGEKRIRKLNKEYRGRDRSTDVLSFDLKFDFLPKTDDREVGEVVLCLPVIKRNALKYGSSFKKEIARALIHGVLHILGYDHERSEKDAEIMKEKEERILAKTKNVWQNK